MKLESTAKVDSSLDSYSVSRNFYVLDACSNVGDNQKFSFSVTNGNFGGPVNNTFMWGADMRDYCGVWIFGFGFFCSFD